MARCGQSFERGEVFAKVLTSNDDSGRHGVLIPNDAYAFFPDLDIADPAHNSTATFSGIDVVSGKPVTLAYKYYERYPERRITRLNPLINDRQHEPRLTVFIHAQHADGTSTYYVDCANSSLGGNFAELFGIIFGNELRAELGAFVMRPVDSTVFAADESLGELLRHFDGVSTRGWVDSLREGDTGIGYTFESLIGIKENNDRRADFKGIEIKCKSVKDDAPFARGKINLFQQGPVWAEGMVASAKVRIKALGRPGATGLFSCHSQVTTLPNNLGLMLQLLPLEMRIELTKDDNRLGHWLFSTLQHRLIEKHSRAVVVKASTRRTNDRSQFHYKEVIYCERPSIDRFLGLVANRNIVFEFLMSEKADGSVRNHGYPWRLIREEFIEHLYTFQVKLR